MQINIMHLAPSIGKFSFGIGPVVLNLARYQQALGYKASIGSLDSKNEADEMERYHKLTKGTIHTYRVVGPKRLGYSPMMLQFIKNSSGKYQIIHQHGIWTAVSYVTNRWRARTDGPTVIAPHGSLDPWALKRSLWKKKITLALYERANLEEATCLHALSVREAEGFREFRLTNPIAIIPNGISRQWLGNEGDAESFRKKFGILPDKKILFFIGRITPIKGLPMLIRAMHELRAELKHWKLVIAGVDEFGHQREVQALTDHLSMQDYILFAGPLFKQDKRDAFAAADLFVLPSYSEGAPMVVLEALGAGVPVLTTKASPWEELATHQCGWWTDISVEAIAKALEDALRRPSAELREMGKRGRKLVSEKYTWPRIAKQTLVLYKWLLNGGDAPDFVITE